MMNLRKYFLKRKLAVLRIYPRVQILGKVSYRSSRIVFPKVYRNAYLYRVLRPPLGKLKPICGLYQERNHKFGQRSAI